MSPTHYTLLINQHHRVYQSGYITSINSPKDEDILERSCKCILYPIEPRAKSNVFIAQTHHHIRKRSPKSGGSRARHHRKRLDTPRPNAISPSPPPQPPSFLSFYQLSHTTTIYTPHIPIIKRSKRCPASKFRGPGTLSSTLPVHSHPLPP